MEGYKILCKSITGKRTWKEGEIVPADGFEGKDSIEQLLAAKLIEKNVPDKVESKSNKKDK